jgi:hypothetical protein
MIYNCHGARNSGCWMYVFEESTRRCAIDRKGRGRKEVIYLRVADISYTRGVHESMGLSYGGPCGAVLWHYPPSYRGGAPATLWLLYIYKRDT